MANEIAETIAQQIGDKAFFMLGSRGTLLAHENGLQFDVRGSRECNRVVVTLEPSDTYTVAFWKGRGLKMRKVSECELVYADSLHATIEKHTGLYTSL